MFRLLISAKAKKELKVLKKKYQEAIISDLEEIKEEPFIGKALTRELTGKFSYRIGVFRIVYKVSLTDKTVYIITAGHRSVVYN